MKHWNDLKIDNSFSIMKKGLCLTASVKIDAEIPKVGDTVIWKDEIREIIDVEKLRSSWVVSDTSTIAFIVKEII